MQKLLFLPFLSFPSGHQQASDALISQILEKNPNLQCEKIDLFSYSYGKFEAFISSLYLKWIHHFPKSYSKLYLKMVVENLEKSKDKYLYERFFSQQLERLLKEVQPDCIICTHSLPSRLLSRMKREGKLSQPVFNVYTDFFIHKGWGIESIDGHFISTIKMKDFLLSKNVKNDTIHLTGIPVHPLFNKKPLLAEHPKSKASILISGGSMGTGNYEQLIKRLNDRSHLHYFFLCGKNRAMYEKLRKREYRHITPVPYIASRKLMNLIYNQSDFIITKPGGVTVSECFEKRIPILIYDKLPGQEEINLNELRELNLIVDGKHDLTSTYLSDDILDFLYSPKKLSKYFHQLHQYEQNKLGTPLWQIILESTS